MRIKKQYYTNCPNCSAPLPANGKCDYCGTIVKNTIQKPINYLNSSPTAYKAITDVYIRSAPSLYGKKIGILAECSSVTVLGFYDDWAKVECSPGIGGNGYILKKYLHYLGG